jgi:enamine deaminase RidA (YjgF/YER057c/UK114 family)
LRRRPHPRVRDHRARRRPRRRRLQQAKAALEIIAEALDKAGSGVADVVRTVTYVTDVDDAMPVAKAHREVFADVRPAATLVEVAALMGGDQVKVEIEAYAVAPVR